MDLSKLSHETENITFLTFREDTDAGYGHGFSRKAYKRQKVGMSGVYKTPGRRKSALKFRLLKNFRIIPKQKYSRRFDHIISLLNARERFEWHTELLLNQIKRYYGAENAVMCTACGESGEYAVWDSGCFGAEIKGESLKNGIEAFTLKIMKAAGNSAGKRLDVFSFVSRGKFILCAPIYNGEFIKGYIFIKEPLKRDTAFVSILCRIMESMIVCRTNAQPFEGQNERDCLTGLLNKNGFYKAGQKAQGRSKGVKFAVIVADIDKFKFINRIHSMEGGNGILKAVGNIIKNAVGGNGVCARFYADIFYILFKYEDERDILSLTEEIDKNVKKLLPDDRVNLKFGIYKIETEGEPFIEACEQAAFIHKYVKEIKGVKHMFFDNAIREKIIEEKEIEDDAEAALAGRQFEMYLQPKYKVATKEITGAEALVRWNHPFKGVILPDKFIPVFERNGFILKLDYFIWKEACVAVKKLADDYGCHLPISVNMSRLHLKSRSFADKLEGLVEEFGINRRAIKIELTENIFLDDMENVAETLETLHKKGFELEMDDFGSGYSSLNALRNINFDTLKIDRNFFDKDIVSRKGKMIVSHIISLAKALGINVIAEGVETDEQERFILYLGCDTAQGYNFSKPVPFKNFEENIKSNLWVIERGGI